MSAAELAWLAEAARAHEAIFEIGSYEGRSTKALAMATSGVVCAIDNGPDDQFMRFARNLAVEIATNKVVPMRQGSIEAAATLGLASMIFIDGDHTGDGVATDIATWRPHLTRGGLLCGHDYGSTKWPGVSEVVDRDVPGRQIMDGGSIWYARAI